MKHAWSRVLLLRIEVRVPEMGEWVDLALMDQMSTPVPQSFRKTALQHLDAMPSLHESRHVTS